MILKQILIEAPEDKRLSPVSRKPSDVTYDNLPVDVKALADAGKWAEAYSKLVNAKDIDVFLDKFIDEYSGFSSFKDKITPIRETLKRELMNMGSKAFAPETNPILAFLNTYFALGNTFTDEQFKTLLGYWGNGLIDDKMLKLHGPEDHIIFNKNLYDMTNSEFIVQAYNWLSKKKNIEAYVDLNTMTADVLEKNLSRIRGDRIRDTAGRFSKKNYPQAFRDLIIFKEFLDVTGEINPANEIQVRLQRLQDLSPSKEEPKDEKIKPERYTKEEIEAIFRNGLDKLDKSSLNKLLNFMRDKGWL